MSVDASLGHKLGKRLKLAAAKSKTSKQGKDKKSLGDPGEPESRKIEKVGKGKTIVSDTRKKRVYADQDVDEEVVSYDVVKEPKRKNSSKRGQNKLKAEISGDKNIGGNARTMWSSLKKKGSASLNSKTAAGAAKVSCGVLKTKTGEGDEKHGEGKKGSKSRNDNKKQGGKSVSTPKSSKKMLSDKRTLGDDSDNHEDQPKKKKRVIRIDPYDISNKRLDDGIVLDESSNEKKMEVEKKSTGMSKNAQFRAIQPSPSILSFVEENLLGRRRMIELRRAGYNIELSAPLDNIPFSTSTERERVEESMFRNKLTFFAAANVSSSFPPPDVPEIAFAGRSNVGKSSLLNALTRQWGVVRTSDKPGLTQTINFFNLGPKIRLVDLPGYGFAYAKDEVKDAWEELVKEYVSTRVGLKRVCLLIDTKWGVKPRDRELINLMERSQTKYQIVLTKTDVVFPIDVARRAMQIEESLKSNKSAVQPVMMVSSKSGAGIQTLRRVLAKIARFGKA